MWMLVGAVVGGFTFEEGCSPAWLGNCILWSRVREDSAYPIDSSILIWLSLGKYYKVLRSMSTMYSPYRSIPLTDIKLKISSNSPRESILDSTMPAIITEVLKPSTLTSRSLLISYWVKHSARRYATGKEMILLNLATAGLLKLASNLDSSSNSANFGTEILWRPPCESDNVPVILSWLVNKFVIFLVS